jgi:hypothetical protein
LVNVGPHVKVLERFVTFGVQEDGQR